MFSRWGRPTVAIGLTAVVALVGLVPAQDVQQPPDPSGDAGFFGYSGGFVRAKRARTQTSGQLINESAGWVNLSGATLSYSVPLGTTDLFNVAFSAECRLINSVPPNDYVRIRILDNGVPMEPYDGAQAFCSANGYATHKGNWIRRAPAGFHTLQVQFWIWDGFPSGFLQASIDDWTFELVVYD